MAEILGDGRGGANFLEFRRKLVGEWYSTKCIIKFKDTFPSEEGIRSRFRKILASWQFTNGLLSWNEGV